MTMLEQVRNLDYRELLASLPDESVDLFLTDPPYGIGYSNNFTHRPHDVLAGDEGHFSYEILANEAMRVMKPNTAFFAYTGWSTYPHHFWDVKQAGFKMQEPLICQKRASGKTDLYGTFQSNADWLLFAHKGRFVFQSSQLVRNKRAGTVPNPGRQPVAEYKTRFPSCWFGGEYPWSSENHSSSAQADLHHPTIKSLELMEWIIRLCCPDGGTVCDPFAGSGTVALAADNTGRRWIAGEIDSRFCDMANGRIRAAN